MELLSEAVCRFRPWLEDFRHKTYAPAFQDYCARYGSLYDQAAQEAKDLRALAEALLDELEQGWKRQRPWNRSAVRASEKQMLVVYLSPMLLEREEPRCRELCEVLREAWNARWPKDGYRTAGFETIQSGFRNTIMGIELRGFQREDP